MKTLRRHWYDMGGVVAILTGAYLAIMWSNLDVLQRLLIANFIAMLLHQFEEYSYPGGEPAIMNLALSNSSAPNRFPLNQNSAMVTNLIYTYVFCLAPVFFPNVIWLGLAPMLAAFGQLIVHGIFNNMKMKSIYNPGLGAVVFIHLPISIYYIYYIILNNLTNVWTWVIGILYVGLYMFFGVNKLTYSWLADKNSPYIFDKEEMERFHVKEKLEKNAFTKF